MKSSVLDGTSTSFSCLTVSSFVLKAFLTVKAAASPILLYSSCTESLEKTQQKPSPEVQRRSGYFLFWMRTFFKKLTRPILSALKKKNVLTVAGLSQKCLKHKKRKYKAIRNKKGEPNTTGKHTVSTELYKT